MTLKGVIRSRDLPIKSEKFIVEISKTFSQKLIIGQNMSEDAFYALLFVLSDLGDLVTRTVSGEQEIRVHMVYGKLADNPGELA